MTLSDACVRLQARTVKGPETIDLGPGETAIIVSVAGIAENNQALAEAIADGQQRAFVATAGGVYRQEGEDGAKKADSDEAARLPNVQAANFRVDGATGELTRVDDD